MERVRWPKVISIIAEREIVERLPRTPHQCLLNKECLFLRQVDRGDLNVWLQTGFFNIGNTTLFICPSFIRTVSVLASTFPFSNIKHLIVTCVEVSIDVVIGGGFQFWGLYLE